MSKRKTARQKAEGQGIAQVIGSNSQATVNYGVPSEQVERMMLEAAQRARTEALPSVSVPHLPANFVSRPEAIDALCEKLLAGDGSQSETIALTAVAGMGGIGKTVLAQALCRDERVKRTFPDGIFWQTIGKESTINNDLQMRAVVRVLGGGVRHGVEDRELPSAIDEYQLLMGSKAALLVIDDVWRVSDIGPWITESPRSRVLFTTRNSTIADSVGARQHWAELLSEEQSREVFSRWAGIDRNKLSPRAEEIVAECRQLPLALAMVGAMLRGKHEDLWQRALQLLRNADLEKIKVQFPNYPYPNLFVAIKVSVEALEPLERERYCALAVLLEEMAAPRMIQQILWGTDAGEAAETAETFVGLSLAQRETDGESIRLHDLQLDYIRTQYADKESLELIHGAVQLSSPVIGKDPGQFASQMVGRLMLASDRPEIGRFTAGLRQHAPCSWMQPMHPVLDQPGGALRQTLKAHYISGLNGIAVSGDGRRAVSNYGGDGGRSGLRVWDLDSGREVRTLKDSGLVLGVAVSRNGRRAVSASHDGTLKVWNLDNGQEVRTLKGHSNSVSGVAVIGDGRRAVSASLDGTLKVWNLDNGQEVRTLKGHSGALSGVAVSRDGRRAVSASQDGTLKVWDLDSGQEVQTFKGDSRWVSGVAVSGDGRRAISGSADGTLKVRDLDSGHEVRTLKGHSGSINGVAVSEDGRRGVSASHDRTLKVWDLDSGQEVQTLQGHLDSVLGVAMSRDGRRAISVSYDQTLKVWQLGSGQEVRTLQGHFGGVMGVAVSPDGKRAVSASHDGTLKVWNLDNGQEVRTLKGHSDSVNGVAVIGDGRRAVSASSDQTLKVWDLESGQELHTLKRQSGSINGVAVSRNGRYAVSTSSYHILNVWDLKNGQAVRTLQGHRGPVTGVAVSGEGWRAVSASADETLKVWDLDSGQAVRTLQGHRGPVTGVAMSLDGRRAVSASKDGTLKVWQLGSGQAVRTLQGHSDSVTGVAMSLDGQRAVSASSDQTLKVWDLYSGSNVATFTCEGMAYCCAFAGPDRIVAGDIGGRVYFLELVLARQGHDRQAMTDSRL